MSIEPILTFKAGRCEKKVHAIEALYTAFADAAQDDGKVEIIDTPGYIYLYHEDGVSRTPRRP